MTSYSRCSSTLLIAMPVVGYGGRAQPAASGADASFDLGAVRQPITQQTERFT